MKNILTATLIFWSVSAFSQYIPVVNSDSHWLTSFYDSNPGDFTEYGSDQEVYFQNDSIINDTVYSKLWIKTWRSFASGPGGNFDTTYANPEARFYGLFFEDEENQRFYTRPFGSSGATSCGKDLKLVWDFGLEVGDTSTHFIPEYGCVPYKVDSIVFATDILAPRRKFFISSADDFHFFETGTCFVEGIGAIESFGGGAVFGLNPSVPDYNRVYSLECFLLNNENLIGSNCFNTTAIEEYALQSGLRVKQNHIKSSVTISIPVEGELRIYHVSGSDIIAKTVDAGQVELNLSNQPSGMYVVHLNAVSGETFAAKIIK